jgi:hypothetical protein
MRAAFGVLVDADPDAAACPYICGGGRACIPELDDRVRIPPRRAPRNEKHRVRRFKGGPVTKQTCRTVVNEIGGPVSAANAATRPQRVESHVQRRVGGNQVGV